jgi:uncharacterized protein (TIGR02466 family)
MNKNLTNSTINGIFPTPIYFSKLNRELNLKELSFIEKIKLSCHKNQGNLVSDDNYILNQSVFKNLKKELNLRIKDYFEKIIVSSNDIKPYITQSWLNYTETNQYHHRHEHPNSLVSGVFYINCDDRFDKIKFFNNRYYIVRPQIKDWNLWNSDTWWFPVKTGDIIMFPSSLTHMVETKQGTNTRISLAFNVFIKGKIGNKKGLTELFLK